MSIEKRKIELGQKLSPKEFVDLTKMYDWITIDDDFNPNLRNLFHDFCLEYKSAAYIEEDEAIGFVPFAKCTRDFAEKIYLVKYVRFYGAYFNEETGVYGDLFTIVCQIAGSSDESEVCTVMLSHAPEF